MGKSQRTKGAAGEREFINLLKDELGDLPELKRNLDQYQESACDLVIANYAIEIKRQEALSIGSWWKQACDNADGLIPALAYRQSRQPWRVIVPYASQTPVLGEFCEECQVYHYPDWAEDLARSITMFAFPLFADILRETLSAHAQLESTYVRQTTDLH